MFSSFLILAGCSKGPVDSAWKEFVSPDGSFSVLMAGAANEETQTSETGLVSKTYHIVTVLNNVRGMAVSYAEVPTNPKSQTEVERVLNRSKEQASENLKGELMTESDVSLGGYPGKEIQILLPKKNHVVRQRTYLANRRLYSIMAITSRENIDCAEAKKFFDSFRILK